MEFLKRFTRKKESHDGKPSVRGLHPDFWRTTDKYWYFNRELDILRDRGVNVKARFAFDDPAILARTKFLSKIGPNEDAAIPHRYIGFSYAKDEDRKALEEYARRFPFAELIVGLNRNGQSFDQSERIPLVQNKSEISK